MLLKQLNQFKQRICYPKAMATSKMYSRRPVLGENYRYIFSGYFQTILAKIMWTPNWFYRQ
jgi:hypothetical protein